jgi:hypothetical protein
MMLLGAGCANSTEPEDPSVGPAAQAPGGEHVGSAKDSICGGFGYATPFIGYGYGYGMGYPYAAGLGYGGYGLGYGGYGLGYGGYGGYGLATGYSAGYAAGYGTGFAY